MRLIRDVVSSCFRSLWSFVAADAQFKRPDPHRHKMVLQ
jgi:hypothetical protein